MAEVIPALRIKVEGDKRLQRALGRMNLSENREIMTRALLRGGFMIQRIATQDKIVRGGKGQPKATKLTSRTGTLRRSISVDRTGTPFHIDTGSDLVYASVHETGGTFAIKETSVEKHQRTKAFGKSFPDGFTVPAHTRKAHKATFPKRAFLEPALEDVGKAFPEIILDEWRKATFR